MKIFGSGMDVTVIQLVAAVAGDTGNDYFAIGGPYNLSVSAFEAADFTVDCNMAGQPSQTTTCAAIAIGGNHIRLRRVRAINFGTQCVLTSTECFALASGGLFPVESEPRQGIDCIIEDCIVEQPSLNNTVETTCLALGGSENDGDGRMGYLLAPAIRRCIVDCEYRDRPTPIASITVASGVATVTTSLPHGRATGDWVRISGVLMSGSTNNSFNGAYVISSVSTYGFNYTPNPGQTTSPTQGDMWVGRWPSLPNGIASATWSGGIATIQTSLPHFLAVGSAVRVNSAVSSGPGSYDGLFTMQGNSTSNIIDAYTFTYPVASNPGTISSFGFIGVSFFVLTGGAGTASVTEDNRVLNCYYGGPHHDTFTTRDQIVRNNYFRAVVTASDEDLEGGSYSKTNSNVPLDTITSSGLVATATMYPGYGAHGLVAGDPVTIVGASDPNYNSPMVGGVLQPWTVLATPAPTATQFSYTLNNAPAGTGYYASFVPPGNQRLLYSLTYDQATLVATATVDPNLYQYGHGLSVGDAVLITKGTDLHHYYNGRFTIIWTSSSQFQYQLPADPGGNSAAGYYGRIWQTHNMAVESNVFELTPTPSVQAQAVALKFGNPPAGSPLIFVILLARNNIVRHVDGTTDPGSSAALAISVKGCGGLRIDSNTIDLQAADPVQYGQTQNPTFFSNSTPGGAPILGYDTDSDLLADDLSTAIVDVTLLSL